LSVEEKERFDRLIFEKAKWFGLDASWQ